MQIYQNYWKIDSCSLTFEVSKLDSYDQSLHDEWILVNKNTSEIHSSFSRKDYKEIELDGVRYDVKYYVIQNPKTLIKTRYINMIIYSRHLFEHYFKGINDDTLVTLYSNIMDTGLIECSFQTFIEAKVSNPDFAIDSYATPEMVDFLYKQLKTLNVDGAKTKGYEIGGVVHSYQYGQRKSGRKLMYSYTQPFFKLYSKLEDSRSSERKHVSHFYDKIGVDKADLVNYYRYEMTIKDKSHLNHYLKKYAEVSDYQMTLSSLCQMIKNIDLMKDIRIDMLEMYLKGKVKIDSEMEDKKVHVLDKIIKNIVEDVVSNSNMNITETIKYIMFVYFKGVGTRKTQYNYEKKVTEYVKLEHIVKMKNLDKDGIIGLLNERGAVELVGCKHEFEKMLSQLVL